MTHEIFDELLDKGESQTVDYKEKHYFSNEGSTAQDKKDKDAEFIKDILSLINTIRSTSSYIVIGVKEENGKGIPVGINSYDLIDNAILQQKVKDKIIPIPKFTSYPYTDREGKIFQIIEVPVIWYPSPCVARFSKGDFIVNNKVYVRSDSSNTEADQIDIQRLNAWLNTIPKTLTSERKLQSNTAKIFFTDEVIQKLFGNEAAEDEDIERLKEYYFKNDTYNKITVNLPIRILVGHKGIGKSALFKIARSEDNDQGRLAIPIKPNEINDLGRGKEGFLESIENWRDGLMSLILKKSFTEFGIKNRPIVSSDEIRENFVNWLIDFLQNALNDDEISTSKISFAERFLDKPIINVYIDDLDRGWIGGKSDINRISTLLNSVRDITQENRNLQFKISLRSDVYYLVRTSDESTDKIQSSVIWYQWTQNEILIVLIKRVLTFLGKDIDEGYLKSASQREIARNLDPIIEPTFYGTGNWANVPMHRMLLSVIRKRPRDLVKLLTLAARNANNRKSGIIQTRDFNEIFNEYSQDRIQDTENEYKSELPEIKRLIFGMKPDEKTLRASESYYYTRSELIAKIEKIRSNTRFIFSSNPAITVDAKSLAQFLYKINFITATKKLPDGFIDRKDFEDNRYLSSDFVDFGYDWEVHMAFRWGLQPNTQEDLFSNL